MEMKLNLQAEFGDHRIKTLQAANGKSGKSKAITQRAMNATYEEKRKNEKMFRTPSTWPRQYSSSSLP